MGKVKSHTPKLTKKFYPFVSVCTPTFNRRPFIPTMFECFKNQTYPKDRIEWIIVDDGTDCIEDLIQKSGIKQIRYFRNETKMSLGQKRNHMHSFVKGTIIVYMDDDDYYPPERIEHAVDKLQENREAMCAGSSDIYISFMYQGGPYGPNHATAGTFAFRTEMLKDTRYEDHAALAEERHFLKEYTIPFVQLDPMKTILVFSHEHNTFDKRKLLENQHPDYFKESGKTVDMFIRKESEASIRKFFMEDIDRLLVGYEPGEPKMKPDVLEQMKKIEADRNEMMRKQQGAGSQIMINQPGQSPRPLTTEEIMQLLNQQTEQINALGQKKEDLEKMVVNLQKQLAESYKSRQVLPDTNEIPPIPQINQKTDFENFLLARIEILERENSELMKSIQINTSTCIENKIIEIKSKTTPEIICIDTL